MDENKNTTTQATDTPTEKPKRVSKFWEACQKYKDDWIIYDPTILDRIWYVLRGEKLLSNSYGK